MSEAWLRRDRDALADAGKLRFGPMTAVRGAGVELIEPDGRRVLDFSAGWGAASLGYGHPAIVAAVSGAIAEMPGVGSLSIGSPPAILLAEALLGCAPGGAGRRVWLGHSGTDASDAALRLATAGDRRGVISFRGAYHGGFGGGMAISGHAALGGAGSHPGLFQLDYPGDSAAARTVLEVLSTELATGRCGALFVEPILSDGGLVVPPPGFLRAVGERCRSHGVLVVCDEVKAGVGRTGRWYASDWEGLEPDLVILGKGLGGGLPISAVIGPAAVMNAAPSSAMLTTQGNPVSTAAALAVVETVRAGGFLEDVGRRGALLTRRLGELLRGEEIVREIRGRGLMIGVELGAGAGFSSHEACARTCYRAWELGLLCYYVGTDRKVLELTPPLVATDGELERGAGILAAAVRDTAQGRVDAAAAARWAGW